MTTTDKNRADALTVLANLLSYAKRQICTHENTHRGGAIWEICDACGAKWADDEGGKPKFRWPDEIVAACSFLNRLPVEQHEAAPTERRAVLTTEDVERQYRDGVHIGSGLPRATCPCGFCMKHRHGFNRGDEAIRPEPRTEGEAVYRIGNDGVCRIQAAPLEGTGNGADGWAAFDMSDAEWCDVFERIQKTVPNVFGSYMKVRAEFAREVIRIANAARALLATQQPEPRAEVAGKSAECAQCGARGPKDDWLCPRSTNPSARCARAEVADAPVPDWMTCESRRPFVVNSIRARSEELRQAEHRCRNAYRKDFMGIPTRYVADAYGEAAAVLEARLAAIEAARAGGA